MQCCDVIKHDHWCHKVWMWCDVDWVWCHMCAKCDDLHTCCDVINTAIHQYRCVCHLCDDTDTVAVVSNMVCQMSGIVVVLSWKQYGDSVHIGYDVINILGVMLSIEMYNVINSCCDSMHTELDVPRIVCVMSYREWVWYKWYPVWWHRYCGCSVRHSGSDGIYNICIAICMMSYTGCVMSWMQWMQCDNYNGMKS